MDLTKQEKQAEELLKEVIKRAWEDASFKEELVASPHQALEKVLGKEIQLPGGYKLVAVDQTDPSTIYLNIPKNVNQEDIELTDEQLELVAGGELAAVGIGLAIVGLFAAGIAIGQAMK